MLLEVLDVGSNVGSPMFSRTFSSNILGYPPREPFLGPVFSEVSKEINMKLKEIEVLE